ncbi:hypothetical protein [Colwellia sp. PAMC 21821]|uniref:hypothetical protein n=1 Tax=Colwellia sp. PAMC 21821 TaxID=1816219 RepID=UPI0009BD1E8E|nr:hypothetical protein [Colwellia sp. PAMC 21821]ARD45440.1 hypothetical protein A3Q33_14775 [Colwellia sp. PAMC 21821]
MKKLLLVASLLGVIGMDNTAHAETMNTSFKKIGPTIGSIKDLHSDLRIIGNTIMKRTFIDGVEVEVEAMAFEALKNNFGDMAKSDCLRYKGQYKTVYYGAHNVRISQRQLNNKDRYGNQKLGQEMIFLFDGFCAYNIKNEG